MSGVCRECGCTNLDCSQCVERIGVPCYWVEDDLCSACVPTFRRRLRSALVGAASRLPRAIVRAVTR